MLASPRWASAAALRDGQRWAASFALASLQHVTILALLAAYGASIPAPTAPPARVVLSLADFGLPGAGPGARSGGATSGPAVVVAAPSPPVAVPMAEVKRDPTVVKAPPVPAPVPAKKTVPVLRKPSDRPLPPTTKPASPPSSTQPPNADIASTHTESSATTGGGSNAASATGSGDGAGRGSNGDGSSSAGGASYRAQLIAWLDRHKRYPARARAIGLEGKVVMRVAIDRSGKVRSHSLEGDGRYAVFVQEAEEMVRRADPFPAVPEGIAGDTYEIVVPIDFRLQPGQGRG